MANILKVDYEEMPKQANQMRELGREIDHEFLTVYNSMQTLHNSWFGQRYNSLIQQFNNIAPSLNELLELVINEIPYTLQTVANNYAIADKGVGVTEAGKDYYEKVNALNVPTSDVGMKFISNEVIYIQTEVATHFQTAIEKMDVIEAEYLKISWESEASEAFKIKFKTLKNNVITSIDGLKKQFVELMNRAQDDIDKTEKNNTVK